MTNGENLIVEPLFKEDMEMVSQTFIAASAAGDGFGASVFRFKSDVISFLKGANSAKLLSAKDRTFLGIIGVIKGAYSRSRNHVCPNIVTYLDKSIRGMGVTDVVLQEIFPSMFPERCIVTRSPIGTRGSSSIVRCGWHGIGIVPGSVKLSETGWLNDVIMSSSLEFEKCKMIPISEVSI